MKNEVNFKNRLVLGAQRQRFLFSNIPKCPKCASDQVQLIDWNYPPAHWRCRICKHKWYCEPIADGETKS